MSNVTVLVTGANRGIGLGFVQAYLGLGCQVIAGCRNPAEAVELQELLIEYGELLHLEQLDVTNPEDFRILSAKYSMTKIDILINNAGVINFYFDRLKLSQTNPQDILKAFEVNLLGSVLGIQAFEQNLARGANPRIINISSMAGSISSAGGFGYAYRISKCSLNMLTAAYAKENPAIITVALRPGWVKTELGGSGAILEVVDSVSKMVEIIDNLDLSDSGRFIDLELKDSAW